MRRESFDTGTLCGGLDDLPQYLGRHAFSPGPPAPQRTPINDREHPLRLFNCQPVSNANSDPTDALDSSDAGSEFRTQKAGIGSSKRNTSDSCQAKIDDCGCVLLLFEKDPVSQDQCSVE